MSTAAVSSTRVSVVSSAIASSVTAPSSSSRSSIVSSSSVSTTVSSLSAALVLQEQQPGLCVPNAINNSNGGYTGSGYIDTDGGVGVRIVWSIKAAQSSQYALTIRYANGTAASRPSELVINWGGNGKHTLPFASTGSWNTWATEQIKVDLVQGDNVIELISTDQNGLANIDQLSVSGSGLVPGACDNIGQLTSSNASVSSAMSSIHSPSSSASNSSAAANNKRYRFIWSSDFPPIPVTNSDPDDVQSIVRLALYANELDIEGVIASAGTYGMVANKKNFDTVWNAYEKVQGNLKKHHPNYPTADAFRAITYEGKGNNNGVSIQWGCGKQSADVLIGTGKDSEGSNAIIAAADKPDSRPLWVGVAGGPREVAQAIWKVRNTRSDAEAKAFIGKLRVFLIACQDGTHDYIMKTPGLFVIESKKTYSGFFCGGQSNCNRSWVNQNIIENHGPLGAIYPPRGIGSDGVCEGDSPAFMHLISAIRGINDPENPAQAGWGGQYKKGSDNKWLDGSGASMKSERDTYQKEFSERADWMLK
ncbi:MAG: DUF1593 domain-containing protein [Marinagarivorans sp.]|nr:DUF1593 domain-containing protein [Marinagarivorans sp.]